MATYHRLIEQLYTIHQTQGVKLGLENMERLQRSLGFPDRAYRTIHVAGTNGKGSVATKIAKALELSGYKSGLYTSPHLSTFRERICINGQKISIEAVEKLLRQIFEIAQAHHIHATAFEVTTALALLYYAQEEVDVAVLEVGLGGRLDATNVVCPQLCVITSISFDHKEILGQTLEKIAQEKAGIIKSGVPVILGPCACGLGIEQIALQKGAPCIQVPQKQQDFIDENRSIAKRALEELRSSFPLSQRAIDEGILAVPPCRFEPFLEASVLLDVAHNVDGLKRLFQAVDTHYQGRKMRIVAAFSRGKEIKECVKVLASLRAPIHFVDSSHPRLLPFQELMAIAQDNQIECASPCGSLRQVLPAILEKAREKKELLVICGSCFMMHDARAALGKEEESDCYELNEQALLTLV